MHQFHSIYIREMLALLLSRDEGQMWCSPHLSPCGTSRLRFRTCKHSGNMNDKLCRSKRGGRHGKAKGAEHVDTTGYSRCSLKRVFSCSFHLESLSLWFVVTVTRLNWMINVGMSDLALINIPAIATMRCVEMLKSSNLEVHILSYSFVLIVLKSLVCCVIPLRTGMPSNFQVWKMLWRTGHWRHWDEWNGARMVAGIYVFARFCVSVDSEQCTKQSLNIKGSSTETHVLNPILQLLYHM